MNKRLLLMPLLLLSLSVAAQPSGRVSWNAGWTFSRNGSERKLDLPHDWGVEEPFLQENPGETGKLAWWGKATYTKDLEVRAEELAGHILLEVDGAFSNLSTTKNEVVDAN